MKFLSTAGAVLLPFATLVSAIDFNAEDEASIKAATKQYAYGLMSYYKANATDLPKEKIGIFPDPHYWWEAGAAWGAMIEYSQFTDDQTYVKTLQQALVANYGPNNDIILPWKKAQEGNDDQAFWALAIMSALEYQFPDPEGDVPATYLQVAENCFNNIVSRWDTATCNGGLKWQIYPENAYGYNYKNSISNGATFALGARLARYTGNQTYADWATKIYDWSKEAGFISEKYEVFDGADDRKDCKNPDKTEWSYNLGVYIHGAATLFDITKGDEKWKKETQGFMDHAGIFFKAYDNATDILYEVPCETGATGRICNLDQQSFKAYLARFLAKTAVLAPFTKDQITTWLKTSAIAAAKSCADDGTQCGSKWYTGSYDGQTGTGQQLSALEVTQALLTLKRDTKPATGSEQPKHEPKPSSTPAPSSAPTSEAPKSDTPKSDAPKSEAPKTETPASSTAPSVEAAAPTSTSPVDQKAPADGQCSCGVTTVTVYEPPTPSSTPCTTSTTLTVTVPFPTPTGNATVPGNVTVPSNPPNNTGPDQFQGAGSSFKVTALTLVGAAVLAALSGLF